MHVLNNYPDGPDDRARVRRELDQHAKRWEISRDRLIFNVLAFWVDAMALDGEPKQLKLPTTDALNALAWRAKAAREELLSLAAKRNPPTPKRPTPKQIM
jgi:hypothetical protein